MQTKFKPLCFVSYFWFETFSPLGLMIVAPLGVDSDHYMSAASWSPCTEVSSAVMARYTGTR